MSAVAHATAAALCAACVLLTLACSIGVLVMRDPLQRMHFVAPPSTLGVTLLGAAIALEAGPLAGLKPLVVLVLLAALNGVVAHALARAAYVRRAGAWPPDPRGPEHPVPPPTPRRAAPARGGAR